MKLQYFLLKNTSFVTKHHYKLHIVCIKNHYNYVIYYTALYYGVPTAT